MYEEREQGDANNKSCWASNEYVEYVAFGNAVERRLEVV
jgi:hypothetical protein